MFIEMCFSKIHRATVTGADPNYGRSITIDAALVEAAKMVEGQAVLVNSLSNGTQWKTYVAKGERGKGEIVLNGPPARWFMEGDIVIILAYGLVLQASAEDKKPLTVLVDKNNKIIHPEDK